MRVKSDHRALFWRTLLLPLTLLVPASVAYTVLLQITHAPSVQTSTLSLVNAVVVALIFWGTGTLLLWRRFWQLEARLFFLMTQSIGVGLLFFLAYSQSKLYPDWMAVPRSAGFHFAGTIVVHFYLTFPARLGSPRQRNLIMVVLYGLMPFALAARLSATQTGIQLAFLYNTFEITTAAFILVYAYLRSATPDSRRRLRLVVFGNLIAFVPSFVFYLLPMSAGRANWMPDWMVGPLIIVAPLSYLYAIVRHNLFGIDRLLNRTLVYVTLSIGILLLYAGPLIAVYRWLPADLPAQLIVVTVLTLLVGLSFDWVRTRVQRWVDRLFYGGWYDYPGVVETISEALARCTDRTQLADVLTRQVPTLMQLQAGQLWIGDATTTVPSKARLPQLQFPLIFQGKQRGQWLVGARRDDEDFTTADRRILKTLTRQAETALSNVLLIETLRQQLDELHASRETLSQAQRRLLRSREDERARLARDLHDGPLQVLVGLNLQTGLLLSQWGESVSPVTTALKEIRAEVQTLLIDLRQVCAELRPPMLDTLGLGAALRALADEWSAQSGVAVQLDLSADGTLLALPADVAVNLYRIAQEALSNIARHAAAQHVALAVCDDQPGVTLSLQDDGLGFTRPSSSRELIARGHYGLVGIQERVDLIDGQLQLDTTPGRGTQLRVTWRPSPTDRLS
jgi:two-component system NarL family sensor kinase